MRLRFRLTGFLLGSAVVAFWSLVGAATARAADTAVTDCSSDADLRAALTAMQGDGGGTLTFACGGAPPPIVLTGGALPAIVTDTTVDGGGVVTISGGNASRIFVVDAEGSLTLQGITIVRGLTSGDGGAIYNQGSLTITDSSLRENRTTAASGGAVVTYGPTTIINSELAFNEGVNGGALYPRWGSVVTITGSTFHDNEATGFPTNGIGGALLIWDGPQVSIEASTFYSNAAGYTGGAIQVTANSSLTLTTSTLEANKSPYGGAAVWNGGTAQVSRSLLRDNRSDAMGTGGVIFNNGTLTLVNSTLTENGGPGLYNWGTAHVVFSTITRNLAHGFQGGYGILSATKDAVYLKNTIVAGNNSADCNAQQGEIQSQGFNIVSDGTCQLTATGDQPNTDPQLSALGDRGGPTLSRLPEEGSPALDNGQCAMGIATDQRGFDRPDGPACDVGAVEAQHYTLTVERTEGGTVVSSPPGIECGDDCAHAWFEGTSVTLTATPAEGYTFGGWGGACAGQGAGSACPLLLDAPLTAQAIFMAEEQTVWLPAVQK